VVRRVLLDLLGRFSDEKGLGGILLDDLGNVPLSAGVAAVGDVADLPALKDLRPNKLDRKADFLLLPLADTADGVSVSVCDPSYGLGMRERTNLSTRSAGSEGFSNVISM
jgi:hypothetical protein